MPQRITRALAALLTGGFVSCSGTDTPTDIGPQEPVVTDTVVPVPLTAMENITYRGFAGGLYPDGNDIPQAHLQAGSAAAAEVERLDANGQPDPSGSYVLLSVGMSNAAQEFCAGRSSYSCNPWTFVGQAVADPDVNDTGLQIVNGAYSRETAASWDSPTDDSYDRVLADDLQPRGLSELQVQVVWLKNAHPVPMVSLPDPDADAYALKRSFGNIVRAIRVRYPNTKLVFLSSRTYAGYATTTLNPEPYAYESGFAVKWLVEAQIQQAASGSVVDAVAGDLSLGQAAPWIGWGPYLWADGANANPDGLAWLPSDFQSDGTHPSQSGEEKVGAALLEFFKSSPLTRTWFLR
jgi:hypothetical protein